MPMIRFSLAVFILLFLISATDILLDWKGMGGWNVHIVVEMVMGLLSLLAFLVLLRAYWRQHGKMDKTKRALTSAQTELNHAKHQSDKLKGEFAKIIQNQFEHWGLTQTEKEVALLLLKGLSLEEVAIVRQTKEKTVRQQASHLYKKAGLAGRHELVAYFFEDLLM